MERRPSSLRRRSWRVSLQLPLTTQDTNKMRTRSFHHRSDKTSPSVNLKTSHKRKIINKKEGGENGEDKENQHSASGGGNMQIEKEQRDLLIQQAIQEHRVEREKIQKRVKQSRHNESLLNNKLAAALKELQRIEREFEEFRKGANQKLEKVIQENKKLKRKLTMKHPSIALEQDQLLRLDNPEPNSSSTTPKIPRTYSACKPPRYMEQPRSAMLSKRTRSEMIPEKNNDNNKSTSLLHINHHRQRPVTMGGTLRSKTCNKIEIDRLENELNTLDSALPPSSASVSANRQGLAKSQSACEHHNRRPRMRISSFRSGLQRKSFERRSTSSTKSKRSSLGARASIKWTTGCFEGST